MLIADILGYPELRDGDDLAARHRPRAARDRRRASRRLTAEAARRGADDRVATLDRRAALEGADYVINMIQVGGHAATVIDYEIPARYGLRQTIGDTLGIGGIFRALRTIPVMVGIAADMAERLPRRLAAQLHEPDGDALLGDLRGHARRSGSSGSATRSRTPRAQLAELRRGPVRGGHLPRRRRQPPGVHPALRARRREPLPAARRGDRARSRAAPPGPRRDLPAPRLLPDRVERARGRVPALVPARRRGIERYRLSGRRLRAAAARRTSPSTSGRGEAWPAGDAARRSSAASSTRRRSSTRSRRAPPRVDLRQRRATPA